jgi:hypothetical protein
VREALQVLDFVEGEIERDEVGEGVEALNVGDEVVIEVDFSEGWGERGWDRYGFEAVLAETEALGVGWLGRRAMVG